MYQFKSFFKKFKAEIRSDLGKTFDSEAATLLPHAQAPQELTLWGNNPSGSKVVYPISFGAMALRPRA